MKLHSLEQGKAILLPRPPVPGSPADKAGMLEGDLVVAVNGEPVTAPDIFQLLRDMDRFKAGDVVRLEVRRGEELKDFELTSIGYTQEDFDTLNHWLMTMESRKYAAEMRNRPAAACEDRASEPDLASERWTHFLLKTLRGASSGRMTVRRRAEGGALQFEMSPPELALPDGFTAADLPSGMRELAERLRAGDALHYRLSASGGTFSILSDGAVPSYLTEKSHGDARD